MLLTSFCLIPGVMACLVDCTICSVLMLAGMQTPVTGTKMPASVCTGACILYYGYVPLALRDNLKKEIYWEHVYQIQFGSNQSLGKKAGHNHPTYVFPSGIKAVVRAGFPKCVRDYPDSEGPQVKLKTKLNCASSLSHLIFTGMQADI